MVGPLSKPAVRNEVEEVEENGIGVEIFDRSLCRPGSESREAEL